MPVRRIDNQFGTANPNRPTQSVVSHYYSNTPKEAPPQGSSIKLQSSISSARGDRNETKISFAHRTGITSTLNADHHPRGAEADAQLLATSSLAMKSPVATRASSPYSTSQFKGTLTTNRAAYNVYSTTTSSSEGTLPQRGGAAEGGDGERAAYSYLRGPSFKPVQYHELPYGRECDYVIGEKMSVYREDFCASKAMKKAVSEGHAPNSPRLLSVYSPSALLQKVHLEEQQSRQKQGTLPVPPIGSRATSRGGLGSSSPRKSEGMTMQNNNNTLLGNSGMDRPRGQQQQQEQRGYGVFMGAQLIGSEKAERNVDAQARREIELLRHSTAKIEEEGSAKRAFVETMLTPRTMRLQALQREKESSLSTALNAIPSPPRLQQQNVEASVNLDGDRVGSPSRSCRSSSPRLAPLINRSMLERAVPQQGSSGTSSLSPRSAAGRQWLASNVGDKGVFGLSSTIPADIAPRTVVDA